MQSEQIEKRKKELFDRLENAANPSEELDKLMRKKLKGLLSHAIQEFMAYMEKTTDFDDVTDEQIPVTYDAWISKFIDDNVKKY